MLWQPAFFFFFYILKLKYNNCLGELNFFFFITMENKLHLHKLSLSWTFTPGQILNISPNLRHYSLISYNICEVFFFFIQHFSHILYIHTHFRYSSSTVSQQIEHLLMFKHVDILLASASLPKKKKEKWVGSVTVFCTLWKYFSIVHKFWLLLPLRMPFCMETTVKRFHRSQRQGNNYYCKFSLPLPLGQMHVKHSIMLCLRCVCETDR